MSLNYINQSHRQDRSIRNEGSKVQVRVRINIRIRIHVKNFVHLLKRYTLAYFIINLLRLISKLDAAQFGFLSWSQRI
jgi:hypothetical protein